MEKITGVFLRVFCVGLVVGALAMVGGCGGGGGGSSTPATAVIASGTLNATNSVLNGNGTITTTSQIDVKNSAGTTLLSIPTGTIITGSSAFASLPANITISAPTSGVSGMPNPITSGFVISSTAGAEDIIIGGLNTVAFSQPVTVSIVVDPAKITTGTVNMNKKDGNGWINMGPATVTGNVATFTTSNFCWFGVDNLYGSTTGSTGSTGGTGTGSNF